MAIDRSETSDKDNGTFVTFRGTKVTLADVYEFVAKRIKDDHICESCGASEWGVVFADGAIGLGIPAFPFVVEDPTFIPIYFLVCDECGFMRGHAIQPIAKMVIARSASDA